jgi:hypothetical protein
LVDVCSEPGYSESSLLAWNADDWQDFIDDLYVTKDLCLSPNCSQVFGLDDDGDDPMLPGLTIPAVDVQERLLKSQHRSNHKSFTHKVSIIEKTCQMNMLLSPIRQIIEQQISSGATGPLRAISQDQVKALYTATLNSDSVVVRDHLFRLQTIATHNYSKRMTMRSLQMNQYRHYVSSKI